VVGGWILPSVLDYRGLIAHFVIRQPGEDFVKERSSLVFFCVTVPSD